jgi:hypothetical protein
MSTLMTPQAFQAVATTGINKVFETEYELMRLQSFEKWVKEAYPEVFKQYGYVVDAGYNGYE